MTHPKTYKAIQVKKAGAPLEVSEVEWKDPQHGQVVVKVLACGVCHSDGAVIHQHMPTGLPRVPGHEIIGDVVAVGEGEKLWKVGERVGGGWHGGHCFECSQCRKGNFILCENENINGIKSDGGYAEYVTLRSESVVRIPADADPAETAPLLCAGVTTFNSLRHMDVSSGDIVAVQGLGGLGHLALQFANKMGYKVVALSSGSSKEKLARELGAHEYVDGSKSGHAEALQKLGGAKVAICTAPNPAVIKELLAGLKPEGTLLLLAAIPEVSIVPLTLIQKRLTVRGWPSGTPSDSEDTIDFAKAAGVRCRIEKYSLADAQKAVDSMLAGKANFRGVLIP